MGVFRFEHDDKVISVDHLAELLGDLKNFVLRANSEKESLVEAQIKDCVPEDWTPYKGDSELMSVIQNCEKELIEMAREEIGFVSLRELRLDAEILVRKIASYLGYVPNQAKVDACLSTYKKQIDDVLYARQQSEQDDSSLKVEVGVSVDAVEKTEDVLFFEMKDFPASLYGHTFTEDERFLLANGKELYINGFIKSGRPFSAYVKYGEKIDCKTGISIEGFSFRFD